jgi:hypothetical protein
MSASHKALSWRVSLLILMFGSFVWLGAVHARIAIGNTLLKPGTSEFANTLAPEAERELFRTISRLTVASVAGYAVTVLAGTAFLFLSPLRLKANGWLLMSAILFILFLPVEAFTMTIDVSIIRQEFFTAAGNDVFRTLFLERVGALAGVPFIAILCYYTIIVLAVFQPLKKPTPHEA